MEPLEAMRLLLASLHSDPPRIDVARQAALWLLTHMTYALWAEGADDMREELLAAWRTAMVVISDGLPPYLLDVFLDQLIEKLPAHLRYLTDALVWLKEGLPPDVSN